MNNNQNNKEPDQNNSNSKLKYFLDTRTFNQPLTFSNNNNYNKSNSILYNPNNQLLDNIIMNTSYTRNNEKTRNNERINKVESKFDSKYFPSSLLETKLDSSRTFGSLSGTSGLQFDYSNKINIENEFKIPEHSKTGEISEFKSKDGRSFKLVNDRRRNLDHSDYIRSGSMSNSGFGNLNDLSIIKYGDSTRDIQGSIRDSEVDRFHFTYRNYQHEVYGSNPLPGDTRYLNKKF